MKTYKIHLLRHGRTLANEEGVYIGSTDLPLSPAGLKELLEMKAHYTYPAATRFFTSPLMRCRQTLEVLYPHCAAQPVAGLAECHFGEWEGHSIAELKHREDFLLWMSGNHSAVIPGGETAEVFQKRVMAAFEDVVREVMRSGDTETVICTHGGVIMLIMAAYGLPRGDMKQWVTNSGSGFTLRITPSVWTREPVAEALCAIPWESEA
jgi:alpha-ribazole phosphatase